MKEYLPIFLQVIVAIGFAAAALITSVVLGPRTTTQLEDSLRAIGGPPITPDELEAIDLHAVDAGVNLWGPRSSEL